MAGRASHDPFEIAVKRGKVIISAKRIKRGDAVILLNERNGVFDTGCVQILLKRGAAQI